jgi:hypothetical protein
VAHTLILLVCHTPTFVTGAAAAYETEGAYETGATTLAAVYGAA